MAITFPRPISIIFTLSSCRLDNGSYVGPIPMNIMILSIRSVFMGVLWMLLSGFSFLHADIDENLSVPVDLDIVYRERTIGTPRLHLMYGRPALMSVDRINGYSMRVVLSRAHIGDRPASKLDIELFAEQNGRWVPVSTPSLWIGSAGIATIEVARPESGQPLLRLAAKLGAPIKLGKTATSCVPGVEREWRKAMRHAVVYGTQSSQAAAPLPFC